MKIGILTFHFAFNQGAVLQCYALQKFLERQGHEVLVIDYRPRYHTIMHAAWRNPFVYSKVFWGKNKHRSLWVRLGLTARSFLRCMYWDVFQVDRRSQASFQAFVRNHLHLTTEYQTLRQLQDNPPEMDVYISGSDQVWNPELLGGYFDPAYFLDFGKEETRRVTYAISMGKRQTPEVLAQLKDLCRSLDAISLREYSKADIEAVSRDVHVCIDPTFLLAAEDYSDVESAASGDEPYVFVYGFETNGALQKAVDLAVTKYHCRVVNGSPKWLKIQGEVENVSGYGPDRFLSFVKNAKCIITNSFHGTAFSIIYRKDFITVPHTTRRKRMEDLLFKLGLCSRLFGHESFSFEVPLDYVNAYIVLGRLKAHSMEYLKMSISGCRGETIPHHPEDEIEEEGKSNGHCDLRAYYGFYLNNGLLRQSASGGVATALSERILAEKGVVVGVAFSADYKSAEFQCIENTEKLDRLKGSKYIPPKTIINGKSIYEIVGEKLGEGRKVLFVGSGCHVAALSSWLSKKNIDESKLYTVDLICHGPTMQEVYDDFLRNLEIKYKSKLVSLNMRYKKSGWTPPYVKAIFANGKQFLRRLYETEFGFALRVCTREACYQCRFKGNGHVADVTIGDFWGVKPGMKEYNKNGVSAMLSRTKKGEELIDGLDRNTFFVGETEADRVIKHNQMYECSLKRPEYIDRFRKDLMEKGLHYAVFHSKGLANYLKLIFKNRVKTMIQR